MCLCVLKMYLAMLSGDHYSVCVFVLKMYPAMVFGDHEGKCVEDVSSYFIW